MKMSKEETKELLDDMCDKKRAKLASCPMCQNEHARFHVVIFDSEKRMDSYNTWLVCQYCDYEVPLALVDAKWDW